jgi:hypothetical protein
MSLDIIKTLPLPIPTMSCQAGRSRALHGPNPYVNTWPVTTDALSYLWTLLKHNHYQSPRYHVKLEGAFTNLHDVTTSWTEPRAPTGVTYMLTRDPQPLQFSLYACFNLFFRNLLQGGTKDLTVGRAQDRVLLKFKQNLNFGSGAIAPHICWILVPCFDLFFGNLLQGGTKGLTAGYKGQGGMKTGYNYLYALQNGERFVGICVPFMRYGCLVSHI